METYQITMPERSTADTLAEFMQRILYSNKDFAHSRRRGHCNSLMLSRFYEDDLGYAEIDCDRFSHWVDDELLKIALDCVYTVDNLGTKETFTGVELFIYFETADLYYAVEIKQVLYPDKRSLIERLLNTEIVNNIFIEDGHYVMRFHERRSLPYRNEPVKSAIEYLKEVYPGKYEKLELNKFTV